jgi:hypothetical protein
MSKQKAIDKFYNSLGISTTFKDKKHLKDETLFNLYQKPKKEKGIHMPHFENNVSNAVQQADILYLPDDKGYKYALVIVDIADHRIDAQQLKTITAQSVLNGFKTIYKRNILQMPSYEIITDQGNEFKSVVSTYFHTNKIIVKHAKAGRHRQVAIVEAMNKIIGKAIHMRQTAQELETNEPSREWIEFLPIIVEKINEKLTRKLEPYKFGEKNSIPLIPKNTKILMIGQKVRVALDEPRTVAGDEKLHGGFRESDVRWSVKPTKINNILIHENQPILYTVDGIKNVGYTRERIQLVSDKENKPSEKLIKEFIPEKLSDKRKFKNKIQYLTKWVGYPNEEWTYLSDLRTDTNKIHIDKLIKDYTNSK